MPLGMQGRGIMELGTPAPCGSDGLSVIGRGIPLVPGTTLVSDAIEGHLSKWEAQLKRDRAAEKFYNI